MDYDIIRSEKSTLSHSGLWTLREETRLINAGAVAICRQGHAVVRANFVTWRLTAGTAIVLFPGDVVSVEDASDDLDVEALRYDSAMLREASFQLEHAVYSSLRRERCFMSGTDMAGAVDAMLGSLRAYSRLTDSFCMDRIVLCLLKAFFLAWHDMLRRRREHGDTAEDVSRAERLFSLFMEQLEKDYKLSRQVAYYARKLNVSPKHLTRVTRSVSGQTPKTLIDHYITLQIKLLLRTTDIGVKQLAYQCNFSDEAFFCRHFRQRTGMTPLEYRRRYKGE